MTDTCDSTKLKIDQVITDLERLKMNIASIEARYKILGDNFSNLCAEFLDNIKTSNASNAALMSRETVQETFIPARDGTIVTQVTQETRPSANEVETATSELRKEIISVKDLENESPVLGYPKVYEASLTDILETYAANNIPKGDIKQVPLPQFKAPRKNVFDVAAYGIEKGLDKLGNGLIYPFVIGEKLVNKIRGKSQKT